MRILGRAVLLVLYCVFLSRIIHSTRRLFEGKIGVSTRRISAKEILYPSLTVCRKQERPRVASVFGDDLPVGQPVLLETLAGIFHTLADKTV